MVDEERKVSLEDYQVFRGGTLWDDLQSLIRGRMSYCQTLLANSKDAVEMYRLQGHLKELEVLLNLPDVVISDFEYDQAKLTTTLEVEHAGADREGHTAGH